MEQNKSHKIKTIQDISNVVTSENIDNFLKDFEGVLRGHILLKSVANSTESKIEFGEFEWTDDNKHDITFILSEDGKI